MREVRGDGFGDGGMPVAMDERGVVVEQIDVGAAIGILDTAALYLFPWQAGKKDAFIRVTPDSITGRRFKVTAPMTWWTQLSAAVKTAPE